MKNESASTMSAGSTLMLNFFGMSLTHWPKHIQLKTITCYAQHHKISHPHHQSKKARNQRPCIINIMYLTLYALVDLYHIFVYANRNAEFR